VIVIAAVPFVDTHRSLAGPATLKAALAEHGIDCRALDLNAEVVAKLNGHWDRQKFLDFFYRQTIHDEVVDEVARIVNYCADRILAENPTTVGLSLFCHDCQVFTGWLCAVIRQRSDCRILIGGPGINRMVDNPDDRFIERMQRLGLIDDYISGDGDVSVVEYFKGNLEYTGINSKDWLPIADLNKIPHPDLSDYNFFWYREPSIPIVDSRGCVRTCEFCDVIEYWKKFQYKSADNIFNEMLSQMARYNVTHFDFRSSISNGNLREFKKLIAMIVEYNQGRYRSEQISWEGSFIIRQASQHPESLWQQLKASNATLFLGIESVVPRVRNGLGKSFQNEDIDYHLEMTKKYDVAVDLLFIGAYPTETQDDYEFTKQWFRDRKQYAPYIRSVSLSQAIILPGTRLYRNSEEYGLANAGNLIYWHNTKLGISVADRSQYYQELRSVVSQECSFNLE
jgi:hypothetical protein